MFLLEDYNGDEIIVKSYGINAGKVEFNEALLILRFAIHRHQPIFEEYFTNSDTTSKYKFHFGLKETVKITELSNIEWYKLLYT